MIYANTAYGGGLRQQFQQRAAELGVTPVSVAANQSRRQRFHEHTASNTAAGAAGGLLRGSLPEAIIIVQQMKELGIKATFVGGDTLFQPDFLQAGPGLRGRLRLLVLPRPAESRTQAAKNWVAKYRDEFKRDPGGNSSGGYVAAQSTSRPSKTPTPPTLGK